MEEIQEEIANIILRGCRMFRREVRIAFIIVI